LYIDSKNFDAGHIISEYNGGEMNVDNIVPICRSCNSSMGKKNMNEYIQTHHPECFKNFMNKKYNLIIINSLN
jgi:5-methylcytosine-specific restriction endonuclease McrA